MHGFQIEDILYNIHCYTVTLMLPIYILNELKGKMIHAFPGIVNRQISRYSRKYWMRRSKG